MAVYTDVAAEELAGFLGTYDIGELLSYKGIAEGVENSNFLLHTTAGYFILTLYEKRVAKGDLPFFLGLMTHLASRGISCPEPVRNKSGEALSALAGRPAAIINFLEGIWPRKPNAAHCAGVGQALAKMHLAGADFAMARANALSVSGWRPLFDTAASRADEVQHGLRAFIAEGATIVTYEGNKGYYEKIFAQPHTLNPDRQSEVKKKISIETVGDKKILTDGNHVIELHRLQGSNHNDGLMVAYLPKEKILVEADAFNPPAQPNAAPSTPPSANNTNLMENIERLKLDVETIIPIHYPADGRKVAMAELLRAVGKGD